MKIIIATIAVTALSGCSTYNPNWIGENIQMGNPNNYRTTIAQRSDGTTTTIRSWNSGSTRYYVSNPTFGSRSNSRR